MLIQDYMQHEEYVQFGLISRGKVHVDHLCVWVLKYVLIMVYTGYFTFGIHWIKYFYIWRYFAAFSMKLQPGAVANGQPI